MDFVADESEMLTRLYDAKLPIFNSARRVTYVIDRNQRIVDVDTYLTALRAAGPINTVCQLHPR